MEYHQIDCFKIHFKILKILGTWPDDNPSRLYVYYSKIFLFVFGFIFVMVYTINFYFLPRQLEIFVEEMIFYFTNVSALSKALAIVFMRDKIREILSMLESETFQASNQEEAKIIKKAKNMSVMYWKITAAISIVANSTNVLAPLLTHLIFGIELKYPVCNYSFISEKYKPIFQYPAYLYQGMSITSHMLYNVNLDTFLLGVMFLAIAQLDILDKKLRRVTDVCKSADTIHGAIEKSVNDRNGVMEINKCIIHYEEVCRFCKLIQQAFSEALFIQFASGALRICACLFRFTLPAPSQFFVFLFLYIVVMILQIMVPCWFGSQLTEKSTQIRFAIYDCDWTSRCRRFKSNLRLLVERTNRPLTIIGGKMFVLSLKTFTAIMNSAYSFFTLLRHMQDR